MDQVAQPALITAVGDGSLKRRIGALTEKAPRLTVTIILTLILTAIRFQQINADWAVQRFSANGAVRPLERSKLEQTCFTNGKSGNSKEWRTTDTAIGGEKSEE